MRKFILAATVATATLGLAGSAQGYVKPDYKLRCRNGQYAKVWIDGDTLKAVNNCGKHSQQWLMIFAGNEDGSGGTSISVQPGATYLDTLGYGWEEIQLEGDLSVKLGRGVFCDKDYGDDGYVRAIVAYRSGTAWKADC